MGTRHGYCEREFRGKVQASVYYSGGSRTSRNYRRRSPFKLLIRPSKGNPYMPQYLRTNALETWEDQYLMNGGVTANQYNLLLLSPTTPIPIHQLHCPSSNSKRIRPSLRVSLRLPGRYRLTHLLISYD